MKKEDMVDRLNELLDMEHRLSVWQFLQIRRYELGEMVSKIEDLYSRANRYNIVSDLRPPSQPGLREVQYLPVDNGYLEIRLRYISKSRTDPGHEVKDGNVI